MKVFQTFIFFIIYNLSLYIKTNHFFFGFFTLRDVLILTIIFCGKELWGAPTARRREVHRNLGTTPLVCACCHLAVRSLASTAHRRSGMTNRLHRRHSYPLPRSAYTTDWKRILMKSLPTVT